MLAKGIKAALVAGVAAAAVSATAHAAAIQVTVTNNANVGGLTLSPLWVGFHNGGFDLFDDGAAASNGLELLAELADASGLGAELAATQGSAVGGVIGTGGIPPIEPGETGTAVFDLDPTDNRFFSFASMVVPSNDAFIGNPDLIELFTAGGDFVGDIVITILGGQIWDAGTEINDPFAGGAFLPGVDATISPEENGVVGLHTGLNELAGVVAANGEGLVLSEIDFLNNPNLPVATITISSVPVSEPGLIGLLGLAGLGLAGAGLRRRVIA